MSEVLQVLGAVLVLVAFTAVQRGVTDPQSALSLALNLTGSGLLASLALIGHQWGFWCWREVGPSSRSLGSDKRSRTPAASRGPRPR